MHARTVGGVCCPGSEKHCLSTFLSPASHPPTRQASSCSLWPSAHVPLMPSLLHAGRWPSTRPWSSRPSPSPRLAFRWARLGEVGAWAGRERPGTGCESTPLPWIPACQCCTYGELLPASRNLCSGCACSSCPRGPAHSLPLRSPSLKTSCPPYLQAFLSSSPLSGHPQRTDLHPGSSQPGGWAVRPLQAPEVQCRAAARHPVAVGCRACSWAGLGGEWYTLRVGSAPAACLACPPARWRLSAPSFWHTIPTPRTLTFSTCCNSRPPALRPAVSTCCT